MSTKRDTRGWTAANLGWAVNWTSAEIAAKERELMYDLCRQAGQEAIDEECFRANHNPEDLRLAAQGNVAALIRLRIACGLKPW